MISSRISLTSAVLMLAGCREPTQVQLELSTDALCDDVRDTSIAVSAAADLEITLSDTSTSKCSASDGRIGSLTIVPADDEGAEFGVRIVTGLGMSADQCSEAGYRGGCIVARRSLRFIPHRTLYLPIEMEVICKDVPCGATQTCSNGRCVDAAIDDVTRCLDPKGCVLAVGGNTATGGSGGASETSTPAAAGGSGGTGATPNSTYGGASSQSTTAGGGTISIGGSPALGGTHVGASEGGGSAAVGGSDTVGILPNGGALANGGMSATDGTSASGGTDATGGMSPNAGMSNSGSAASSGGTSATGGTDATGGMSPSAGMSNSGGTSTTALPAVCGDGIVNPYAGECCDTMGESAACNANCTPARCGDSIINASSGERCDGSTASVDCTPGCGISACGDGYVDAHTGEECESGMGGCNACKQDLSGRADALRVSAKRSELLLHSLAFDIDVSNTGLAVPVNGLMLRYYYTPDSNNTQSTDCTWSDVGCSNVTLQVAALKKSCANASHYLQITIGANANLGKNASLNIQGNVSGGLLSFYTFSNDYSRPQGLLFKTETPEITLYQNGRLVWGTPPCGCGNGAVDPGEQCDHAGESAFCNSDCTLATCGDRVVNAKAGENCDEGTPSLTCSSHCRTTGLPASAAPALLQWLDASQPSSVALSPHVAQVLDQSGRANHVAQAIGTKQPYWFPAGLGAFSTLPAFYFDGINHELVASSPVNDLGRGSVFIVHHVEPVGITAALVANGWSSSGGGLAIRTRPQLDGLGIALGAASGYSSVQWTPGASSGTSPPSPHVTYWAWNPPAFTWSTGGAAESVTATATYTSTVAPLAFGGINAGEPFTGWIGEVLVFDRELSVSERDPILAYLRSKWGVP